MTESFSIVRLGPDEADRLRTIRLQSLQQAPDAFGSTYAESLERTMSVWRRQVVELPTFVAWNGKEDVGIVRGFEHPGQQSWADLISMWVAPRARRQGVGSALVEATVDWARSRGLYKLVLDVADTSRPAIALYEHKGFVRTGTRAAQPASGEHIVEHVFELIL